MPSRLTLGGFHCAAQDKAGIKGDVMPMMGAMPQMMGAPMAAPSPAGDAAPAEAEEAPASQEPWDLKLTGFDDKSKIKVIKEVRAITGLGLKEVRTLNRAPPPCNSHFGSRVALW